MTHVKITEKWKKCFMEADEECKGSLTYDQMMIAARLADQNPRDCDIKNMLLDKVQNRETFNFDDFFYYMTNASNPVLDLRAAFRAYDANRDGLIERGVLKVILQGDQSIGDDEIEEILNECNVNKDNKLDYEDFARLLMQTSS